jgi:copper transport protein
MIRRAFAVCSLILALALPILVVAARPAAAHNTLLSSSPADGAVLDEAPIELSLAFDLAVPLDTVSATWTGRSGVRAELSTFRHGPSDETEVVAALPPDLVGEVTIRWRLVGPDGHPITGRIQFAVDDGTAPGATTPAPAADSSSGDAGVEEPWATPAWPRWLLRYASYVAIAIVGGIVATSLLVWRAAWEQPLLQRIVAIALGVVAGGAVAQLLVLTSDITGSSPWSAATGVGRALGTDAGGAFLLRIALVGALAAALYAPVRIDHRLRWGSAAALLLGLLATWAYAGHAKAMRYPLAGVPLDVVHHAAVSVWVGGLAVVGIVAARKQDMAGLVHTVNRFATVAGIAVVVIVATGVAQTLRLVGSPTDLWRADHGRYLILKVLVLAAMLKVADVNRRRVARHFRSKTGVRRRVVRNLTRAMVTEFGVGLAVIGVTAALVVSPPASAQAPPSAQDAAPAPTDTTALPTTTSTATSLVPAAPCVLSGSVLRPGAEGDDVVCLQEALVERATFAGEQSGTFDEATAQAVRDFQDAQGFQADGVVGPSTAAALGIWPA